MIDDVRESDGLQTSTNTRTFPRDRCAAAGTTNTALFRDRRRDGGVRDGDAGSMLLWPRSTAELAWSGRNYLRHCRRLGRVRYQQRLP